MKLLALLMFLLLSIPAQAAVRCHVDVPYDGLFAIANPPDAFDAVIYYNNSTCPFSLPSYDLGIQFSDAVNWQSLYFNGWEASYSVTGSADNVVTFSFDQTRNSLLNPACSLRAVSTDGQMVYLLNHYWITGSMSIDVGHPTNVAVCVGVF